FGHQLGVRHPVNAARADVIVGAQESKEGVTLEGQTLERIVIPQPRVDGVVRRSHKILPIGLGAFRIIVAPERLFEPAECLRRPVAGRPPRAQVARPPGVYVLLRRLAPRARLHPARLVGRGTPRIVRHQPRVAFAQIERPRDGKIPFLRRARSPHYSRFHATWMASSTSLGSSSLSFSFTASRASSITLSSASSRAS